MSYVAGDAIEDLLVLAKLNPRRSPGGAVVLLTRKQALVEVVRANSAEAPQTNTKESRQKKKKKKSKKNKQEAEELAELAAGSQAAAAGGPSSKFVEKFPKRVADVAVGDVCVGYISGLTKGGAFVKTLGDCSFFAPSKYVVDNVSPNNDDDDDDAESATQRSAVVVPSDYFSLQQTVRFRVLHV